MSETIRDIIMRLAGEPHTYVNNTTIPRDEYGYILQWSEDEEDRAILRGEEALYYAGRELGVNFPKVWSDAINTSRVQGSDRSNTAFQVQGYTTGPDGISCIRQLSKSRRNRGE